MPSLENWGSTHVRAHSTPYSISLSLALYVCCVYREWVEVIRRVRTMPEQKVKSMLVQEVDPRKALLTLDLELIESVTATDQEKR